MKSKKKISTFRWLSRVMFFWMISLIIIPIIVFTDGCSILPKKSPEKFLEIGKEYYNKKNYKKAYKNYTSAIEGNRSYFIAYWERALVEIKMDSLENAIDDMGMYIESMRIKSSDADKKLLEKALIQRADIMFKKGYNVESCDDWNDACQLNISNLPCEQYRLKCK